MSLNFLEFENPVALNLKQKSKRYVTFRMQWYTTEQRSVDKKSNN